MALRDRREPSFLVLIYELAKVILSCGAVQLCRGLAFLVSKLVTITGTGNPMVDTRIADPLKFRMCIVAQLEVGG